MRKELYGLLTLLVMSLFTAPALAAAKRLVCDQTWTTAAEPPTKMERTIEAILDTDDFAKENPQAEVTVLKWNQQGSPYVGSHIATTGKTYRMSYSVTPSTLSIVARVLEKELSWGGHEHTIDISRKDLTHSSGSCSIEDFEANNAI